MSEKNASRIPSLDGLRAVAIALVVIGHLMSTRNFIEVKLFGTLSLPEFGVRVFFVISGLLITNLLLQEIAATGRIQLLKFYFRRTFRILPPHYFLVFFLILVQPLGWFPITRADALHALTYTTNYFAERGWNLGHTWSLAVAGQFYLLWPVVLLFLGKRRGLLAALAFVLLAPFIRLGIFYLVPGVRELIGHSFETIGDTLATGCLLAGKGEWPASLQRWYDRLLNSKAVILLPLLALCGNSLGDRPLLFFLLGYTVTNVCIAICVDWCIWNPTGLIGRVLNAGPLVFVGMLSYSLYLWQQIFLNGRSELLINSFPFNITLALAATLVSYYLIERPALNLRQRWDKQLFPAPKRTAIKIVPPATQLPKIEATMQQGKEAEPSAAGFVAALQRLEGGERTGRLSDALQRVSLTDKTGDVSERDKTE